MFALRGDRNKAPIFWIAKLRRFIPEKRKEFSQRMSQIVTPVVLQTVNKVQTLLRACAIGTRKIES